MQANESKIIVRTSLPRLIVIPVSPAKVHPLDALAVIDYSCLSKIVAELSARPDFARHPAWGTRRGFLRCADGGV
jgi:hypothetical protein